jgi:hypothetical protein
MVINQMIDEQKLMVSLHREAFVLPVPAKRGGPRNSDSVVSGSLA